MNVKEFTNSLPKIRTNGPIFQGSYITATRNDGRIFTGKVVKISGNDLVLIRNEDSYASFCISDLSSWLVAMV